MPKVLRDLQETSGYWAAVWSICPMPDVHVICDAPIGCFNLIATAVTDYTDAVPHLDNITPSVMREAEVGGTGTAPAVRRTYEGLRDAGMLAGKELIVVSTAESEMIGSDLSDLTPTLQPNAKFFYSDSLARDEWAGRDIVLQWLWDNYGRAKAESIGVEPGLVNIIGPTYGCFNSAADLHEVRRLIEGAGGRINMIFPLESRLADIAQLARAQVNVVMYQEFGHTLATTLGQPWLRAPMGMEGTNHFVRELATHLGTQAQAAAFMAHEKRTTLQAVWDLWRGPQGDWFGTTNIGIVASGTYVDGIKAFLGDELGMPITLTAARPLRAGDPDNEAVRQALHAHPPAFLFGSINERIYLSEANARYTNFVPAAFPGPVVRRSVGTPFMGYRGAVYLLQEIVNRLYDVLFNFLPVDGAYSKGPGGRVAVNGTNGAAANQEVKPGNMPWESEAKAILDAALEKMPFLPRISASRELQMQAETLARTQGLTTVGVELMKTILASRSN